MISKAEFLAIIKRGNPGPTDDIELWWDGALSTAIEVNREMPGIGFASVSKRLAAFKAVCRHLQVFVDDGSISMNEAQLALLILRVSSKPFQKASTMFDLRASRAGWAERAAWPAVTQQYFANLRLPG